VSSKSVSFTEGMRREVQNYVRPRTHHEMLMYIGLGIYFHNHVRDMTEIIRSLRRIVDRYEEPKRLEWTPEWITVVKTVKAK